MCKRTEPERESEHLKEIDKYGKSVSERKLVIWQKKVFKLFYHIVFDKTDNNKLEEVFLL